MPGKFIDTNVLLYIASTDSAKADRAEEMVAEGGNVSVQVLNELANAARKKMQLSWAETRDLLSLVRNLLTVHPVTVEVHESGLALAERYRLSIFDSMLCASALRADCDILWSEDMHDGMLLEKRLRITNPFTREA